MLNRPSASLIAFCSDDDRPDTQQDSGNRLIFVGDNHPGERSSCWSLGLDVAKSHYHQQERDRSQLDLESC